MSKFTLRTISVVLLVAQIFGESLPHNQTASQVPSSTASSRGHSALHSVDVSLNDTLRLENVLEVFNIRTVSTRWDRTSKQISSECSGVMAQYLSGLKHRSIWAVKSKSKNDHLHSSIFSHIDFGLERLAERPVLADDIPISEKVSEKKEEVRSEQPLPFAAATRNGGQKCKTILVLRTFFLRTATDPPTASRRPFCRSTFLLFSPFFGFWFRNSKCRKSAIGGSPARRNE